MRIAHVCNWTPGSCGMYETVRDLVAAERKIGVDARIVDVQSTATANVASVRPVGDPCQRCGNVKLERLTPPEEVPDWTEDRGVVKAPVAWMDSVDVVCSHSGLPAGDIPFGNDKPRVHVAHGRPHSSFLLGQLQNNHVWAAYEGYARDSRWKALVTLWPGFARYWRLVFPRVEEFQPFVDLDRWAPFESAYKFGGKSGEPNVVISDVWRGDKDPFHCLFGFAEFALRKPKARLHLYGLQPRDAKALAPVLNALSRAGVLGEAVGRVGNLAEVYNAADLLLTPHVIATRTIRESLACGLPVVAGGRQPYTPYWADPEQPEEFAEVVARCWEDASNHREARRGDAQRMAEVMFDPEATARQFIKLFDEVTR